MFSLPLLAAINHVLEQSEWAHKRLQPFANRGVRIAMGPFSLTFAIDDDGYLRSGATEVELDIMLPADAPLLALQDRERAMKSAKINGPADMAESLSFVLRHLRWDIEEDLSKAVGDIAARRIVSAFDAFIGWQVGAARNLADNFGEYFIDENPTLIKSAAVTDFAGEVEKLRSSLDRLERRIEALSR